MNKREPGFGAAGRVLVVLLVAALAACASRKPAPVVDRTASGAPLRPAKPAPAAATPAAQSGEGYYTVKKGDTLYSIALEHGGDYRELAQWNELEDPSKIRIGQVLRVKPPEPGPVTVTPARIPGRPEGRPIGSTTGTTPPASAKPAPVAGAPRPASDGRVDFIWPKKGKVLAGFAEPRSKGIDIDGRLGDPVVAAAAGRVTYTGSGIPGLGKLVVIKHDNGFITVYAHNRDILVKEQQTVARGQKIAELGNTDADRPKLHFQIRKGSAPVDPLLYLPAL
jgi:lipoprotein NlpD